TASAKPTGGALVRVSISAISPCFHCRRCNCHTPSPINSAKAARAKMVKTISFCTGMSSRSFRSETAFLRLMLELQRDEDAFERPEQAQGHDDGERAPEICVQPIRRCVTHLYEECAAHQNEPRNENDEDDGAVTGIGEAVIEAAITATIGKCQVIVKQLALSASRAASNDASPDCRAKRCFRTGHCYYSKHAGAALAAPR